MDRPQDTAPPPMLQAAFLAQRWGPEVLNADYDTVQQMTYLLHVYQVKSRVRNMVGAEIHTMTTGERRVIRKLMDEGLM